MQNILDVWKTHMINISIYTYIYLTGQTYMELNEEKSSLNFESIYLTKKPVYN